MMTMMMMTCMMMAMTSIMMMMIEIVAIMRSSDDVSQSLGGCLSGDQCFLLAVSDSGSRIILFRKTHQWVLHCNALLVYHNVDKNEALYSFFVCWLVPVIHEIHSSFLIVR